jgi:hypothetical protein
MEASLNIKYFLLYIQDRFIKIDTDGTILLIISYSSLLSKTGIFHTKTTAVDAELPRQLNHLLCKTGIFRVRIMQAGKDISFISGFLLYMTVNQHQMNQAHLERYNNPYLFPQLSSIRKALYSS